MLCEKPLTRRPAEADGRVRRGRARRARAGRGVHVAPPPAGAAAARAGRGGGRRAAAAGPRERSRSTSRERRPPGDVRLQAALDGGALMDVGCYCVSAMRLLGGEPRAVGGRQVVGGDGVDVRFAGTLALPGGVLGSVRLRLRHGRPRTSSRSSAPRGRSSSPTRGTRRAPRIELRRADGTETVDGAADQPVPSRARGFRRRRARGAPASVRARRRGRARRARSRRSTAAAERGADASP